MYQWPLYSFLQELNRRLVAMDERLRSEPQLQGVIDAEQIFFARADHPVTESATADRSPGALDCLRQTVERCGIDIFVNEREGQRRCRGDAAWQGLCGHRRDNDRRVDPGGRWCMDRDLSGSGSVMGLSMWSVHCGGSI